MAWDAKLLMDFPPVANLSLLSHKPSLSKLRPKTACCSSPFLTHVMECGAKGLRKGSLQDFGSSSAGGRSIPVASVSAVVSRGSAMTRDLSRSGRGIVEPRQTTLWPDRKNRRIDVVIDAGPGWRIVRGVGYY